MSSKDKDAILSRFIGITQCPSEQAREYLENTDWDEQAAVCFYFDSAVTSVPNPMPSKNSKPTETKTHTNVPSMYWFIYHGNRQHGYLFFSLSIEKPEPDQTKGYDSDDDFLQPVLEACMKITAPQKSPVAVPKRVDNNKSIVSSKINTVDTFRNNKDDLDSDDDDDEGMWLRFIIRK